MKLHVGCAMWTYAPWQGRYLPHSLSPRDRLRAYATWCNAVEGNTTCDETWGPQLGARQRRRSRLTGGPVRCRAGQAAWPGLSGVGGGGAPSPGGVTMT